ncbi:MAG: hypothetical protein WCC66_05025 [Rhizobiaceae bacterium]
MKRQLSLTFDCDQWRSREIMQKFANSGAKGTEMLVNCALKLQFFRFVFLLQVTTVQAFELDPAVRYGFDIRTQAQDPALASDALYIVYTGPVAFPMRENLTEIWDAAKGSVHQITFEIDSKGGDVAVARRLAELFDEINKTATLTTKVGPGKICASACVALFMQGTVRQASGASSFMFHGVCPPFSNVPDQEATGRFFGMLRRSGTSEKFLNELTACGIYSTPGQFWISGYELFHVSGANIVTELLPSWTPSKSVVPPFDTQRSAK